MWMQNQKQDQRQNQKQGLERLESNEAAEIYEKQMRRDFPENELKPWAMIARMERQGAYDCLGFYEEGQMAAYAFSVVDRERGYVLLDYLAVREGCRGKGYGSRCLQEMKRFYKNQKGLFLECEDPGSAEDGAEIEMRRRRIRFYENAGCERTQVSARLFGVSFEILYLPLAHRGADVAEELKKLYQMMLPGPMYEKHARVTCR
ncbi:GNAT family N-acetyltransferase [Clostridiaceae bacterium]|nr:GNAT family N-acetyltransferase [Clostridiaceae bacterium]RKI12035.1 GNAT family N-acetyltransferase [bacterium 1XD21-70]